MDHAFSALWKHLRQKAPIIHHITNIVTAHASANVAIAAGASPIMAHALEEVADVAHLSDALVLNIGTLTPALIEAMVETGEAANRKGIPVLLDPVGAGATPLRNQACDLLLGRVRFCAIRGNASEIEFLLTHRSHGRGVDAGAHPGPIAGAAPQLARRHACTVIATGAVDTLTDGVRTFTCANGHALMARVTGTGCMASTVIAAFLALREDPLQSALAGLAGFEIAAERAAGKSPGPGTFQARLLDEVFGLPDEGWTDGLRLKEEIR